MADRPPEDATAWRAIEWSAVPGRFRQPPDRWPTPQRPSRRRIFWWRAGAVVVTLGVLVYSNLLRSSSWRVDDLTVLQTVGLWLAPFLAGGFGAMTFLVAVRPYFKRDRDTDEFLRVTRAARRETLRAVRSGTPIPSDRVPPARFWIAHQRSGLRAVGWLGLIITAQMVLTMTLSWWWLTTLWIAYAVAWSGFAVHLASADRRYATFDDEPIQL